MISDICMFSFMLLVFGGREKKRKLKMFYGLAEFYLYFILHVMLLSNVNNRFQSYTETNLRWELLDYYIVYEVTESVQLVYFLEEC